MAPLPRNSQWKGFFKVYTVKASDVQKVLDRLPKTGYDLELRGFNPEAVCSVSIEPTRLGQALLLISDDGQYRVLIDPAHAPRVLKNLKSSNSYRKEDVQGKIQWAMNRAKAATVAV